MRLNLREIIEIPGGSVPFAQELDTALLDFPSVRAYTAPITAEGKVVNTAGILTLQGKLHAQMLCVCDRCGAEFPRTRLARCGRGALHQLHPQHGYQVPVQARLCRTVRPLRREPEPRAVPVSKTPRSKNGCIRAAFG